MYQVGSIILIDNQIFSLGRNHYKTQLDHADKRPAIVICEDEDNFYYLTLTSKPRNDRFCYNTKETILRKGLIKEEKEEKKQYIEIKNIYKKRIYGAIEVTRLTDEVFLQLLMKFYSFHKDKNYKNFKEIEVNILKQIKELTLKLENNNYKRSGEVK